MPEENYIEWNTEQSFQAVKLLLDTRDETKRFLLLFNEQTDKPAVLDAFIRDAERRSRDASEDARKWWASVCRVTSGPRYLALVEGLAQRGVSVNELFRVLPRIRGKSRALILALERSGGTSALSGTPPGITDTKGWADEEIIDLLADVKVHLGWGTTEGTPKKWWQAFEDENHSRWALVLRLAEELANRKATIAEFFQIYLDSGIDNIRGNLDFLDYTRIKKQEEVRDAELTQKSDAGSLALLGENKHVNFGDEWTQHMKGHSPEWTDEQIRKKLEELKMQLGWANATGKLVGWWNALEQVHPPALLLRLAEELYVRKATIVEFHQVRDDSKCANVQANLKFLDYTRAKKEEEERKRNEERRAVERLNQFLPDLQGDGPLPTLSREDIGLLRKIPPTALPDAATRDRLKQAIIASEQQP